ncbi:HU family DNA-binding protein [Nostoc sp. FACHB-888]|nr:HU family DNA-binding protein [Nostoc sp. FACHB-888]
MHPKAGRCSLLPITLDTLRWREAVANGEKVTLIGFGSFERRVACRRRHRSEREGRNPKTSEPMTIPATIVPAFSACYSLKKK